MNSVSLRAAFYVFLLASILGVEQPIQAQLSETLCHIKDKACSSTGAVVGLGLWCCGVTYWCLKLQKNQQLLEKQLKSEKEKRRKLKEDFGVMHEAIKSHSDAVLELEKSFLNSKERLQSIELALYGIDRDNAQKEFRLAALKRLIDEQSSVTVRACGRIEVANSSESLATSSGQESLDASSPQSREGSVSPMLERIKSNQVASVIKEDTSESKPSGCSLM
jgi:hypothetical protein